MSKVTNQEKKKSLQRLNLFLIQNKYSKIERLDELVYKKNYTPSVFDWNWKELSDVYLSVSQGGSIIILRKPRKHSYTEFVDEMIRVGKSQKIGTEKTSKTYNFNYKQ